MTGEAYDPETVAAKVEAFPALFDEDHRVVELDDEAAADRGTHEPGETLFVARVREHDSVVELSDVYRVSERPDGTPGDAPGRHLYFVAKHWPEARFDREDVRLY